MYSPGSLVDLARVHRSTPQHSPSVPRTDGFIRGTTIAHVHRLSPDAASTASRSPVSRRPGVAVRQLITSQSDESMDSGMYIIEFMYILKRCLNLYILLNLCIF